jgi:hypothetical protein
MIHSGTIIHAAVACCAMNVRDAITTNSAIVSVSTASANKTRHALFRIRKTLTSAYFHATIITKVVTK